MYNIVFYFYNKKRQPPFSYMTMKKKTTTTYLMKSILIIFPIFLPQATTGLQKENDGLNIVYHEYITLKNTFLSLTLVHQ